MLGRVLDRQAAEEEQKRRYRHGDLAQAPVERVLPEDCEGSTSALDYPEEVSYEDDDSENHHDDETEDDEEYSIDEADADENNYLLDPRRRRKRPHQTTTFWRSALVRIISIVDVGNVWDSPATNSLASGAYGNDEASDENRPTRRSSFIDVITGGTTAARNPKAALFWFLFLSISYASERSTFKLLVDRVGPFRLFSVELILGGHALLTGIGMGLGFLWNRSSSNEHGRNGIGLGLPLADVGLMAVLDTVYLLLAVISGAHVPPVLTVVLVQTTIPLTACFTQCVHPDGRCSRRERQDDTTKSVGRSPNVPPHAANQNGSTVSSGNVHIISNPASDFRSVYSVSFPEISSIPAQPTQVPPPVKGWGGLSKYHIIGTAVMFLAIFIGLTPAVLSLNQILITKKDAMPERTAYNTIIYCLASIPAAVSQLYKEHTLTQLRQPVDRDTLNLVLSIFQLLFAIIVSPLAYGLQGMGAGDNWTSLYPSKSIGDNFHHGLRCFAGILDESTMKEGYPEPATCRWSLLLVFGHALSIVMVGISCDKLAAATKVMYRGVSFGIICSVIFMFVYQISDKWCEYGPLVSLFHLTSTALLIVGAEVYHRVSLADSTFETVYPSIDLFVEGDGIEH